MGMFDDITVLYKLPQCQDYTFQTKSLDCYLDHYEIREDGTLWHEEYDTDERWVPFNYTGEIRFYDSIEPEKNDWTLGWVEYSSYFVDGKLKELHLTEFTEPKEKVDAAGD